MSPRVLISDALSPAAIANFKERGVDVEFQPNLGKDKDKLAAIIGEFGAYGLVVPGHLWDPSHTQSPAPVPDAATLNDKYVAIMAEIAGYARDQSLSAANYNLYEDCEHQVNGLYTYDRKVLKADKGRVRAANLAVLAAGAQHDGSTKGSAG